VLGYAFKPVSFWHCHRADGAGGHRGRGQQHLRRTPLLPAAGAELAYGRELWRSKVFHVSPFCASRGSYRFRFMRTAERMRGPHRPRRRRRPAAAETSVSGHLQPLTAAAPCAAPSSACR
jgi:DUF1365 family protein